MPDILVEVRGSWLDGKQAAFSGSYTPSGRASLQNAKRRTIGTSHRTSGQQLSDTVFRGERFTQIEIVLFKGRSLEAKRELYRAMVRNLHPFQVPPGDVKVVLLETAAENVGSMP